MCCCPSRWRSWCSASPPRACTSSTTRWTSTPTAAHPTKRFRPIAAGVLPVNLAYAMAIVSFVAAIGLSFLANWQLALVIGIYIVIQLAYCFGLKHQAVLDICIVSSGFLLRAIAGGAAASIPLSQWFLLIMAFGSLFMAAGKRYAELQLAERTGAKIRKSLENYTTTYLRFVWTLSGDRSRALLWIVGLRTRRRKSHELVRDLDDSVHDRYPAIRGGRRWWRSRRARRDRARRQGVAGACPCVDRSSGVSLSTSPDELKSGGADERGG